MKLSIIKVAMLVLMLIAGLGTASCNRQPFEEQKPAVGEVAPAISLADVSGKMFGLSDFRGRVVLVNFWASWCPPCKDEMPGFQKVYLAYEDKGFAVIGVAMNEVTPAVIKELGILFPVVIANERVNRDYGDIAHPPVSFLIGKDGRIIKKVKGVYSGEELLKDVLTALKG